MLREINNPRQDQDGFIKRWFTNANIDLFVWRNNSTSEIESFHLTYDKKTTERAVIWKKDSGLSAHRVDDGNTPGKYPSSPILLPDTDPKTEKLITDLTEGLSDVDSQIRDFIISQLKNSWAQES